MNILFFMCDQINTRALSAYGGGHIQTPNLDRLAREGALLENAYCAWPVCSPSRASVFTGQYPHTHGIVRNVDSPGMACVDNQTVFTERLLAENGYATHYIGRWHTGPREPLECFRGRLETYRRSAYHETVLPEEIRKLRATHPVIPLAEKGNYAGRPRVRQGTALDQETVAMAPAAWQAHQRWQASDKAAYPILSLIGRSIIPPEHQPEALFADQIIERLQAAGDGPFMMTWSVNAPHDPVVIPEPYYSLIPRTDALLPDNFDSHPGPLGGTSRDFGDVVGKEMLLEHIAVYLGMVKFVDDQIGRMLEALDSLGLTEDTLVLFTGDHGDMLGGHGMVYKSTPGLFEETTRVPLLIRYPRCIPAGRRIGSAVSLIDLMPTLLEYAGLGIPAGVQGMSLRDLLEGRTDKAPHTVLCENDRARMVRQGDWKYAWYANGPTCLFNLADDPGETRNLAGEPAFADELSRMRRLLRDEMARSDDPLLAEMNGQ